MGIWMLGLARIRFFMAEVLSLFTIWMARVEGRDEWKHVGLSNTVIKRNAYKYP